MLIRYSCIILMLASGLGLTACSTVRTDEETLAIWFPNSQFYREMATETLIAEADKDIPEAKLYLGMRMMTGDRIERDPERAFAIFDGMAKEGDARAQYFIGAAYSQGAGVSQNEAIALEWFRRSAEGGYDKGQYWYVFMLSRGRGTADGQPDWRNAIPWFERAARQGNSNAQFSMGEAYDTCRGGLPRDLEKAANWYRMADGVQDHMIARYNLRPAHRLGLDRVAGGRYRRPAKITAAARIRRIHALSGRCARPDCESDSI